MQNASPKKEGCGMTDSQLCEMIQQSPKTGNRALFDQYFNYVYAIVSRTLAGCGTREDVEECVADTFAEVLLRLDSIQADSLKAYLGTTAKHKALNACRTLSAHKQRTLPMEAVADIPSEQRVETTVEDAALCRKLLSAIKALGEPDSSIIIQKYYYNRKSDEIAAITGLTPAAVRKRCSRALQRLKQELSEFDAIS